MAILKLNLKNLKQNDIDTYFLKQTRNIEECLVWATENSCSDLYIKVGERPYVSRYGKVVQLPCTPITKEMWASFYDLNVLNELNAEYVQRKLLDISVEIRIPDTSPYYGKYESNFYRYRASFGFSGTKNICTFRMIRPKKPTFDTITYPEECIEKLYDVLQRRDGILIFTGPTGSGKSTTMAACINTFSEPGEILDNKVFITLEDPIENTFSNTASFKIVQKELGKDFKTFELGIKAALREHPNYIIIGECRDKAVICATLEACKTGHGTITTYHSNDVPGTISRMLYHLENDKNLSYDLIMHINMIVSQTLVPSNSGYVVDVQYLVFNDTVRKYLIEVIDADKNVAVEVRKLMQNADLIEAGIVRNWYYQK